MNFPSELKYSKDHEWIRVEGQTGYVGITSFAQKELGDIVYIDVTTLNETIEKEVVFGTVEAVKTVSDLFLPVAGTVTEINTALEKHPEFVNNDPYAQGWIIKMTVSNAADIENLLDAAGYESLVS